MKMPLALALVVVGIALLIFGLNSSSSIQDAFSRLFSGQFTDRTMWLIVGGSVCLFVGWSVRQFFQPACLTATLFPHHPRKTGDHHGQE